MPKKGKKGRARLDQKILENLIELQKVHTDLSVKFDHLAKEISSLLNLFEMAAKSFMEQPAVQESERDKEFLEKIDRLLDENKTLARGLTLLEERMRERIYGPPVHHTAHAAHPVHHAHVVHREPKKESREEPQPGPPPATGRPLPKF